MNGFLVDCLAVAAVRRAEEINVQITFSIIADCNLYFRPVGITTLLSLSRVRQSVMGDDR